MPELPEVEIIARQLNEVLPGREIVSVEVLREKSFREGSDKLLGKKIDKVWRRAKMGVVEFEDWDHKLLVHLKMTGQLIFQDTAISGQRTGRVYGGHPTPDWVGELPSKHTRVVVRFRDGSILYFNDMRVFGWIKTVDNGQWAAISGKLPPDVVDDDFSVDYLKRVMKSSRRAAKLVLLDQKKIGGLGNIYANDASCKA